MNLHPDVFARPLDAALAWLAMVAGMTTTPETVAPVEKYVANLNRKRTVAGVLVRDVRGRVLLLQPSYKPNWEIPGGAGELNESPWATAVREVAEELGLSRPLGALLVVDYVRPQDGRDEGVVFVFDGGVMDETDLAGFSFADGEILSARMCAMDEVRALVKPLLADRIGAALYAVEHGRTVLCEQGRRVS